MNLFSSKQRTLFLPTSIIFGRLVHFQLSLRSKFLAQLKNLKAGRYILYISNFLSTFALVPPLSILGKMFHMQNNLKRFMAFATIRLLLPFVAFFFAFAVALYFPIFYPYSFSPLPRCFFPISHVSQARSCPSHNFLLIC